MASGEEVGRRGYSAGIGKRLKVRVVFRLVVVRRNVEIEKIWIVVIARQGAGRAEGQSMSGLDKVSVVAGIARRYESPCVHARIIAELYPLADQSWRQRQNGKPDCACCKLLHGRITLPESNSKCCCRP